MLAVLQNTLQLFGRLQLRKIRLCVVDLEGKFQTNLQAKSITFLGWKFRSIILIFLLFLQNLSNSLLFTNYSCYSNELTCLNRNLMQEPQYVNLNLARSSVNTTVLNHSYLCRGGSWRCRILSSSNQTKTVSFIHSKQFQCKCKTGPIC